MPGRFALVVDDEDALRESLRRAVEECGLESDTAASGQEALERISRRVPDLVVTDLRMRGMDGLQLLERARPLAPETPFIMVSGHATYDTALRAGRLGPVEFLVEPFDAEALRAAVRRALELRLCGVGLPGVTGTLAFELDLPSDPALRAPLFTLVEDCLRDLGGGLDVEAHASLRFAVQETLMNAMKHGHHQERGRAVHFRCAISPREIECQVEDEGAGYVPGAGIHSGGRGLALVRSLMQRVEVDRGGRRITFARHRSQPAPPSGGAA